VGVFRKGIRGVGPESGEGLPIEAPSTGTHTSDLPGDIVAEDTSNRITRREFIVGSAALGAAGLFAGATGPLLAARAPAATTKKSRIVLGYSDKVLNAQGQPDRLIVSNLVHGSVKRLTGKDGIDAAWKSLFGRDDVVGIKVNCACGRLLSTNPAIVDEIVAGLLRAGVVEENIIVWERTDQELVGAGFALRKDGDGYRCYGTTPDVGFAEKPIKSGECEYKLTKILTERITALINAPILKDHATSGITLALKNHYGSFEMAREIVYKVHENNCSPYLADVSATAPIKDKTRLVITDALVCEYDGGPGFAPGKQWNENAIMASFDPVAMDAVGTELIDKARKEKGLPTLEDAKRSPLKWLKAATELGLGQHAPDMIDRVVWRA
jgi:hypothetical protein